MLFDIFKLQIAFPAFAHFDDNWFFPIDDFDDRQVVCAHFFFLAVFAACLNAFFVGAPLDPGFRIFSFDPDAMRFLLA